jgi:methionyl aminopeptidase
VLLLVVLLVGIAVLVSTRARRPARPPSDEDTSAEARELGGVLDRIFDSVERALRPGLTTRAIDELVQREISAAGVSSSFLDYHGYPAHVTASIDEEVINTIPSERPLADGDLLKLQVGIRGRTTFAIRGWTYVIGTVDDDEQRLLEVGRAALRDAVAAVRTGARTGDISQAIQVRVEEAGYSINRSFVGYRIGVQPHMDPPIPGHGQSGRGMRLRRDWVLSLFVIAHAGSPQTVTRDDRWNTVAVDGSPSVLFSQMVIVGDGGAEVVTKERAVEIAAP